MDNIRRIYVSKNGNDENNGSETTPFFSVKRAQDEVRGLKENGFDGSCEVLISAGDYKVEGLIFNKEDSGKKNAVVTYQAKDGEAVVFNSGRTLDTSLFVKVSGEIAERLSEEAKKNVLEYDLEKGGITKSDLGPLFAAGNNNAGLYDDAPTGGVSAELFWNDERMTVARYPNNGFLRFADVIDQGERGDKRNPNGGTIVIDKDTAVRASKWKELDKAWMEGYFGVDWCDCSSPIEWIDKETARLKMKYISHYGLSVGAEYFFYNIIEELDKPGEYYIDREHMKLYVWPMSDISTARVMISIADKPIVTANEASYITFDGITFEGVRNHAVLLRDCDNITVKNCLIRNIAGWAVYSSGSNNTVENCEICYTGKGGISLSGGNTAKLIHGNNLAINNYIHDWAITNPMYNAGIELCGCGNRASHNELARTTHMSIYYCGTDEIMEYNYIHETVQQSHDAGSIYGGRDWSAYGCIIRYNIIENTGNADYHPAAIYWDDSHSGQTAYGNIIKNSGAKGFLIGGGRDNVVYNNIVMNCDEYAFLYDIRSRIGIKDEGWGPKADKRFFWEQLEAVKPQEGVWFEKYPKLAKLHLDSADPNDELCPANPTGAYVKNNIFVYYKDVSVYRNGYGFLVEDYVVEHGTFANNLVFKSESECLKPGTYELTDELAERLPEFARIPVENIGRLK